MTKLLRSGRGLLGVMMLGAMAFGAGTVLAEPSEAAVAGECRPRGCNDACKAAGFSGGVCNYMDQSCDCFY